MLPISILIDLIPTIATTNNICSFGIVVTAAAIGVAAAVSAAIAGIKALSGRAQRKATQEATKRAEQLIAEGKEEAEAVLIATNEQAQKALESGYSQARTSLSSGYNRARGELSGQAGLAHYGEDALTGKGFNESGGYQFRLSQGQQALDRSQSAAGGRYSGAALKAGMNYNQGLASQEYGNWANLASNLGNTGYLAQRRISDLYGQEGSGLSSLSSSYGTNLANLQSGYGSNMANVATGQATNAANLQQNYAAGAGYGWDAAAEGLSNGAQLLAYGYGSGAVGQSPGDQTVHWDEATKSWLPGVRS